MNPPAPMAVTVGSHTHEAIPAATHASTALPPSARTSAPTCAVTAWPAAIAPPCAAGSGATAPESTSGSAAGVAQEVRDLPRVVVPARPSLVPRPQHGRGGRPVAGRTVAGAVALARLRPRGGRRDGRGPPPGALGALLRGGEPRGDDGDPHLAGEGRVERRAEDDVGLLARRGLHHVGRLGHLVEAHVA